MTGFSIQVMYNLMGGLSQLPTLRKVKITASAFADNSLGILSNCLAALQHYGMTGLARLELDYTDQTLHSDWYSLWPLPVFTQWPLSSIPYLINFWMADYASWHNSIWAIVWVCNGLWRAIIIRTFISARTLTAGLLSSTDQVHLDDNAICLQRCSMLA